MIEQANLERSEAILARKRIEERYLDVDSSLNSLLEEFDAAKAQLVATKKTEELHKADIKQLRQENKNFKDRRQQLVEDNKNLREENRAMKTQVTADTREL